MSGDPQNNMRKLEHCRIDAGSVRPAVALRVSGQFGNSALALEQARIPHPTRSPNWEPFRDSYLSCLNFFFHTINPKSSITGCISYKIISYDPVTK